MTFPGPWRPASGYQSLKDHRTLWRVVRDVDQSEGHGTFEQLKCSNGRLWLHDNYETAKRKADKLNAQA